MTGGTGGAVVGGLVVGALVVGGSVVGLVADGLAVGEPAADGLAVGEPVVEGVAVGDPVGEGLALCERVVGVPRLTGFGAGAPPVRFVVGLLRDTGVLFPVSASVVVVTAMTAKMPRAAPAMTDFFLRPMLPSRVAANEPPAAPAMPPSSSRSRAAARLASSFRPRSSQSAP